MNRFLEEFFAMCHNFFQLLKAAFDINEMHISIAFVVSVILLFAWLKIF